MLQTMLLELFIILNFEQVSFKNDDTTITTFDFQCENDAYTINWVKLFIICILQNIKKYFYTL